jgi:hypothetical protein
MFLKVSSSDVDNGEMIAFRAGTAADRNHGVVAPGEITRARREGRL